MKKTFLKILGISTMLAGPVEMFALGAGTSNSDFSKIGVGARPAAMGEAFVAAADDAYATYWNPAGLALVQKAEVQLMHMSHIADINFDTINVAFPSSRLDGWGLSVAYLWQAAFDSTKGAADFGIPVDATEGTGSDLSVGLSYAHNFGNYRTTDFNISNISMGASIRVINRTLQDKSSSTLLGDIGGLVEVVEGMRIGLMLQNFGTATKFINASDNAPFNVKLGLSYKIGFSNDQHVLQLVYDVNRPIDTENTKYSVWRQGVGGEYWMFQTVALRGGYKIGYDTGSFTAGAGFKFASMNLDYAYVPFSDLGTSHRVSAGLKFGNLMPRPEIAAPDKPRALTAIAGDRFVSLAWQSSTEKDVVGYNVYYSKRKGRDYVRTNEKPEPKQTSLKVRLQNENYYYFVVTSVNAAGRESEFSEEVQVMPTAPTKPIRPTGLRSQVRGRTVELNWLETKGDRVVGYHVYYSKIPGKGYKRLTKGSPLSEPECKLRGLSPGKQYYFVITSITQDGLESDYSEQVAAKPQVGSVDGELAPAKGSGSRTKEKAPSRFDESF